jgi:hypothetical protein
MPTLAPRCRGAQLATARALLHVPPPAPDGSSCKTELKSASAYSGDLDQLFRPNVTGHSAGSAL